MRAAKTALTALKLANASQAAKILQQKIDALPDTYSAAYRDAMQEVQNLLAALPTSERSVLTLTRYNALYEQWRADVEQSETGGEGEGTGDTPTPDGTPETPDDAKPAKKWLVPVIVVILLTLVTGVAVTVVVVLKKGKKTV